MEEAKRKLVFLCVDLYASGGTVYESVSAVGNDDTFDSRSEGFVPSGL